MPTAQGTSRSSRWLRELLRAGRWHRRLLASGLAAGATAAALQALEPPAPPSVVVVTAARDVPSGTRLGSADLTAVRFLPDAVPDGAVTDRRQVLGRTLVSAARRGEPITDVRLAGATAPPDGTAAEALVQVPVRIADPEAVALLRPGDVVDVLGAGQPDTGGGSPFPSTARLLASAVRVVTVPRTGGSTTAVTSDGALVLLATSGTTAARLAGAAVTERLSVVLRGR
jgi:Flp pilus assembly protein CpaB